GVLRGPARGAPARGRHPAAGARGDHGHRRGGVHHLAGGGGALDRRGTQAAGAEAGLMCVVAFAWDAHPRWRLVLAGNRDEFHARPTAALARWEDAPGIVAGRDLEAGGTWLGVDDAGRCALVTNVRDLRAPQDGLSDRKSTRLNSSHVKISYAVFCLKKK